MKHNLKISEPYLKAKLEGNKLFEIRRNDRGYQKGDTVVYDEYVSLDDHFEHTFEITYVCNYLQKENHVVFGEKHVSSNKVLF